MTAETTPQKPVDPVALKAALEFMYRLGQAFLACGEQTAEVELQLRRIASAYGFRRSRVVAFPTALFITVYDNADQEHVTLAEGPIQTLRLDQIADVSTLGEEAERGSVEPQEGLRRLNEILRKPARFGATGVVVGHLVLTVGLALMQMPSLFNLLTAAVLGTIVGFLKLSNRNRPLLAVPLPVIAAAVVSALVFLAASYDLPVNPLHALVPPLVSFLPGGMLSLGMVELAYGDMVSGSSRLITGFVQLLLLAFGLAAGAMLVGYLPENLVDAQPVQISPVWAWIARCAGVLVFGAGAFLHFSAPKKSLGWMLLVLLLTFATQQTAVNLFGRNAAGGFFGMLVATPVGYLIQTQFRGPPAMVTFLPSFWLLVPGALGLMSVKQILSDRAAGVDGMVAAIFALVSIALGTLMGASVYKAMTERFGSWQSQIGRVGTAFQGKAKPKKK